MPSILQDWVHQLGLRHQGVLVAAIRGCDGVVKEDPTKPIMRELRGLILVPFDARELAYEKGFMVSFPSKATESGFSVLRKSLDHYPVHYMFHLLHAMEIVGYCHPAEAVRVSYYERYCNLVRRLHLNPESKSEMDARLNEDRIASDTAGQAVFGRGGLVRLERASALASSVLRNVNQPSPTYA